MNASRSHNKHIYYLVIGSNIQPEENLQRGVEYLRQCATVDKISSVWETRAIGSNGPNFLNAAVKVVTLLPPDELKSQILSHIETQLGRVRTENKFAPRTIDIDIAIVDNHVLDEQVWTHLHFARPLSELHPDCIYDATGETLTQIDKKLSQTTYIKARPDVVIH